MVMLVRPLLMGATAGKFALVAHEFPSNTSALHYRPHHGRALSPVNGSRLLAGRFLSRWL